MYTDETKRAELFVGLKYDPSQNYLTAHLSRPGRAGDALDDYDAAKPAELRQFADDLTAALLSSVGFRESDTHAALQHGRGRGPLLALLRRALVCCETKAEPSARALVDDIRVMLAKEAR